MTTIIYTDGHVHLYVSYDYIFKAIISLIIFRMMLVTVMRCVFLDVGIAFKHEVYNCLLGSLNQGR